MVICPEMPGLAPVMFNIALWLPAMNEETVSPPQLWSVPDSVSTRVAPVGGLPM